MVGALPLQEMCPRTGSPSHSQFSSFLFIESVSPFLVTSPASDNTFRLCCCRQSKTKEIFPSTVLSAQSFSHCFLFKKLIYTCYVHLLFHISYLHCGVWSWTFQKLPEKYFLTNKKSLCISLFLILSSFLCFLTAPALKLFHSSDTLYLVIVLPVVAPSLSLLWYFFHCSHPKWVFFKFCSPTVLIACHCLETN